jgi:hypothetical protein
MQKHIIFNIEKELTDEILNLRAISSFDNKLSPEDVVDKFDEHSFFSTLRFEDKLIGTERITDTSTISVFNEWSKGKDTMPKGKGIYEFSRAVIKKDWRNKAMYHTLTILSFEYIQKINAKKVNCVLDNNTSLHRYLLRLGSEKHGEPFICHDLPCEPTEVQSYVIDLTTARFQNSSITEKDRAMKIINRIGYQVISRV